VLEPLGEWCPSLSTTPRVTAAWLLLSSLEHEGAFQHVPCVSIQLSVTLCLLNSTDTRGLDI
jgi:hypothetical protein